MGVHDDMHVCRWDRNTISIPVSLRKPDTSILHASSRVPTSRHTRTVITTFLLLHIAASILLCLGEVTIDIPPGSFIDGNATFCKVHEGEKRRTCLPI